jgi:hypothetical protein
MRLVRVVIAAALVLAGAGCDRVATAEPVELPTGQQLVALWHLTGGISGSLGRLPVDAPRLVVYSDGLAVADGRHQSRLPAEEVKNVVGTLRSGLGGLNGTVRPDTRSQLADGQDTEIQVRRADGELQKVSAYGLDVLSGYPDGLVSANRALRDLADRVKSAGSDYRADRIRLALSTYYSPDAPKVPWPSAVPVPPPTTPFRVVDLSGAEAAAASKDLARYEGGGWTPCVMPDGTVAGAAWRFLLPHE